MLRSASPTEASRQVLVWICGSVVVALGGLLIQAALTLSRADQMTLGASTSLAIVGCIVSTQVIESPLVREMFIKAGLKGIDLNKATTLRDARGILVRPIRGIAIPESQGAVVAAVYILALSALIPIAFAAGTGGGASEVDHARLSEYLAALLSMALAAFLGFADDALNVRWRHKIPLPFFANLPLLLVYYSSGGLTGVSVPHQLRWLLGPHVELSLFFYIFLLVLAVFSTHAINILAGVNGLEVGQSVILATSVCILNAVQLVRTASAIGGEELHEAYRAHQLQSLALVLPFLGTSLALLRLNWFPSRVFTGDTYAYLAGGTLAAVSIVGHNSKTVVLLLLPQFLNFAYSVPQLLRIVPIPRHRMPAFDPKTGDVHCSFTKTFVEAELCFAGRAVVRVLRTFNLAAIERAEEGRIRVSNLTIINLCLHWFGRCREDVLCARLLSFQGLCAVLTFGVRFGLAGYFYDTVH